MGNQVDIHLPHCALFSCSRESFHAVVMSRAQHVRSCLVLSRAWYDGLVGVRVIIFEENSKWQPVLPTRVSVWICRHALESDFVKKMQKVAASVFLSWIPCQELGPSTPALGATLCSGSCPQISMVLFMQSKRVTSGLMFYKFLGFFALPKHANSPNTEKSASYSRSNSAVSAKMAML